MNKKLFNKYLNNTCSEEELEEVVNLIKNDSSSSAWEKEAQKIWYNTKKSECLDAKTLENILDKIHHKINIQEQNHLIKRKNKFSIFVSYLTKVAAVLLLPVLIVLYYTVSKNKAELDNYTNLKIDSIETVSPIGSRSVIQLADGSVVYLNHGSQLKYPQRFYGAKREVVLIGEAYFKVAHNPEKPFVVKTTKLNITALGTEFNVLAYPDENSIEATLVKGKVRVEKKTKKGTFKNVGTMVPGQHVDYNKITEDIKSDIGNIERYIAWKDGKLVFKDESIVTVVHKLGRWYNVDFEFKDKESLEYTYTATFVNESLTQILDLLKLATPINYRVLPRKKLSNGTFSKQKVVIWKKR